MPVTPTYPGVYIEEISSGVRTITGVATSITAFIGRSKRGPVNRATIINNFGDFERIFGGLWDKSSMSYAVRDFYLNGGSQAVIIRLFKTLEDTKATATLEFEGLKLEAASEGAWGNKLRMRVDDEVSEDVASRYDLKTGELFNLTVHDTETKATEKFLNVTVKESPRRIDRVLANASSLVRLQGNPPEAVPGKHNDPAEDKSIWADNNASTKVKDNNEGSDGVSLTEDDFIGKGKRSEKTGLYALEQVDLFNLLCIPPYRDLSNDHGGDVDKGLVSAAAAYCEDRRAMLIVDAPSDWKDANEITSDQNKKLTDLGLTGVAARNAALFFPRLRQPDPLRDKQVRTFAPCGVIAGVFARTDAQRGVWKAPAGIDATLNGVQSLAVNLNDDENGMLNPLGINCLRSFPIIGRVVWGARTLRGADQLVDEYKYVPVRRLALFLEESLYRGLKWVVFEPNDEPLWAQIRLNVGAFMQNLFRQGAFQGSTPRDAYLVKCDKETTTQNDINLGIVNIVVGFAPLKPAEFVILKIQQLAGQIEV